MILGVRGLLGHPVGIWGRNGEAVRYVEAC
jgi:hypothetical protein